MKSEASDGLWVTLVCRALSEQRHGSLSGSPWFVYLCYCLFNVCREEYIGFRFMVPWFLFFMVVEHFISN